MMSWLCSWEAAYRGSKTATPPGTSLTTAAWRRAKDRRKAVMRWRSVAGMQPVFTGLRRGPDAERLRSHVTQPTWGPRRLMDDNAGRGSREPGMFSSGWRRGTVMGLAAAGAAVVIGAGTLGVTWANSAVQARPAAAQAAPRQQAAAHVVAQQRSSTARATAPPAKAAPGTAGGAA